MNTSIKSFRNSAKLLLAVVLLSLTSCHLSDNEAKLNNLDVKNAELDYLKRVYDIKDDILLKEKIRVLDSIIVSAE